MFGYSRKKVLPQIFGFLPLLCSSLYWCRCGCNKWCFMFIFLFVMSVINCTCPVITLVDEYNNAALFLQSGCLEISFLCWRDAWFPWKGILESQSPFIRSLFICLSCMPRGGCQGVIRQERPSSSRAFSLLVLKALRIKAICVSRQHSRRILNWASRSPVLAHQTRSPDPPLG